MKKLKKGILCFVSLLLTAAITSCDLFEEIDTSSSIESSYSEEISSESDTSEEESSKNDSSNDSTSEEDSTDHENSGEITPDDSSDSSDSSSPNEGDNDDSGDNEDSGEINPDEGDDDEEDPDEGGGNEEDNPPSPPTPLYEVIKPINDSTSSKKLIKTHFETASAVVADVIATDYGADPTGRIDSTSAIQSAVNSVANAGGGTVFLPIGKYIVSNQIHIPNYVSIVGDWNKPDANNTDDEFDYGTTILARPQTLGSSNPQDKPLFSLGDCSGVVGLTFYYVEQSAASVKEYGYTIYANAPATATLRNLTFLNSTYGIGVSMNTFANELVNLENIYGTFLYNALTHNATSDVGFYDNINISTKYWKNAAMDYRCTNAISLDSFVNSNLTAMVLGDLDDQLISNVTIDGGKIGMKFTRGLRADAGFWGVVHKANISCQIGVYADYFNPVSGVVFTDSNVGTIENNSSVGCIKMSNSTYQATGTGRVINESGDLPSTEVATPLNVEFSTSTRLFVANTLTTGGVVDNVSTLQNILNSVSEQGGIVLIPNGIYRLNSTVIIPKNVELRSSQSTFTRTNSAQSGKNGVVFISYASGATFLLKENAGIVGARIWHAKNDFLTARTNLNNHSVPDDTSIKADGAGAYAYMNESVGAYVGYDFSACDNHILKSNYGISYVNFIKAGGKNGIITQCLSNPNFMTRSNLYNYFDSSLSNVSAWERIGLNGEANEDFPILRDDIGRTFTKMVHLENAENEIAFNVFAYGEAGLFEMVNTTATLINTSLDYIPGTAFVYELSGGRCDIIGSLRVYGTSVQVNSGVMTAYGRIAHGEVKEKMYDSSVTLADEIEYVSANAKRLTLFNCDSWNLSFLTTISTNSNSAYIMEGKGSWKWTSSTNFSGKFSSVNISEYKNGYLHFYLYCSDIAKISEHGQIEITSSGNCDKNEYNWHTSQYITKTGWNDIWLDFGAAGTTNGEPDLSAINYIRIYLGSSTATFYIDNIEVVTD